MTASLEDRPGRGLRALVLGGGIMGLCAAWALEREDWSVEIVDQDPVPNPRGASHDRHRLIRHAYGAAHGYMRMVDRAHRDWDALFAAVGENLLVPTGTLALGDAAGSWLADTVTALRSENHPAEPIAPRALPERFPLLRGEGLAEALFLRSGGVLLADRVLAALHRHLGTRGVGTRRGRAVSVDEARAALRLEDGAVLSADLLVVAGGPWAPRLLPALRGRVVPSRQVLVYLEPPPDLAGYWARMPMLLDLSASGGFYAVPPVAGTALKVGDHRFSRRGDPDDPREATAQEAAEILALTRTRLERADEYRPIGARACYYDVTVDENFVLEAPGPATLVMSGFSGHGFKFAPTLGLAAAEAARDPSRRAAIAAWAAGG